MLEINKQETTSIADHNAIPRNLLNSGFDWPVLPSAMFKTTESAALFICEHKLYNYSFGKLLTNISISLLSRNAICQTFNSSNLNAIFKNSD